jgi:hypothetical protein
LVGIKHMGKNPEAEMPCKANRWRMNPYTPRKEVSLNHRVSKKTIDIVENNLIINT